MLARCFMARRQSDSLAGMFLLAVIALVTATTPSTSLTAAADESADEKIAAAKEAYEQGRTAARDAVTTRYRELIAAFSVTISFQFFNRPSTQAA